MVRHTALALLLLTIGEACDRGEESPGSSSAGETNMSAEGAIVNALELMEQERYNDAIKSLELLGENPEPQIAKLREEARKGAEAQWHLRAACLGTNGRDLEAVYHRCRRIEARSKYSEQGCCAGAAERFGERRLAEAMEQLEEPERGEGLTLLQALIDDDSMTREIRERARDAREQARQGFAVQEDQLSKTGDSGTRTSKRPSKGRTKGKLLAPWIEGPRPARDDGQLPLGVWIE